MELVGRPAGNFLAVSPPSAYNAMMRPATMCLALLVPGPLIAQGFSLAPFAASNGALEESPALLGLAATAWSGPVGFRLGGAMDAASSPAAPLLGLGPSDGPHAWSADLDMLFAGGRAGIAIGRVSPGVFVGFGVHGARRLDGTTATIPVWSYGAGASLPLTPWLGADAEARYRMPHESDRSRLPVGVGGGWELRAGLSLHIGSARTRTVFRPGADRARAPAVRNPAGTVRPAGPRSGDIADARAASVLATGESHLGIRYRWGGNTPAEGFDCSGFTRYVFARHGVTLPRVSRDQSWAGRAIPTTMSAFRPGDLLFFAGDDGVVDHVAIYAGDGWLLHSTASGGGVRYDHLESSRGRWYATHLVRARRVIP